MLSQVSNDFHLPCLHRHNARVAKCEVTRLIVVKPTPVLEPLVLKRAIHNFSFSKLTFWKLEMHRLVGPNGLDTRLY